VTRVARIALLGAAATAAAAACSSPEPAYGGPIPDASADTARDALATFYGGPPIDASTE